MFEHKENYGSLFKNDKKEKENKPDYTGKVNVEGALYSIAGWKKVSEAGNTFLSLKISDVTAPDKPSEEKNLPF